RTETEAVDSASRARARSRRARRSDSQVLQPGRRKRVGKHDIADDGRLGRNALAKILVQHLVAHASGDRREVLRRHVRERGDGAANLLAIKRYLETESVGEAVRGALDGLNAVHGRREGQDG